MNKKRKTPLDQPVRDRLVSEFDRNFLVQAGAGSGKTYSLAMRMAAGIAAGQYTVEQMAAVTFTRKAAAELRGRFQLALEERLATTPREAERQRLEAALAGMERLFAGTIHAFCAHLLRERPVDARVAPGFEELSDIDNLQRQRQAWRDYVGEARASGFLPMLDLLEAGIRPKDLYHPFAAVCEHEDVEFDMGSGESPSFGPLLKRAETFWAALNLLRPAEFAEGTKCQVQSRWDEFDGWLATARRQRRLASLAAWLTSWRKVAVTRKWWSPAVGRDASYGEKAKALVEAFQADTVEPFIGQWQAYIHRLAMAVLIEARTFYATVRRQQNVVNYVDLLRVTSAMLRTRPSVRRALQEKYQRLFIDEFQDTDPIQAEIFLMLAAAEGPARAGSTESEGPDPAFDPFALPLRPGALFVVGDPKQSIYRFRRADIDIYNRVGQRIKETGGETLQLTANFRSLPGVCALANTVFPEIFARSAAPYSPPFEKLDPVRDESEASDGPRVATITIPDRGKGSKPEEEEARRIAAYIHSEVAKARREYGDFLVLTRQTPRLGTYAEAFDALEIPVEVSGAGLFCQSAEVQALALLLSALADPLDSVSLVGVLRGPLFGLSDPELFQFHQTGGRFELSWPLPEARSRAEAGALDARHGPVLAAMRRLREMWRMARRLPLAAVVDRILEETGWLALAATTPGGARAGHLLQAIDRVREVAEEGGGLADAAAALTEEDRSSESEALPLEPGRQNVVRLMNLHKAKGLEAEVVFLADAAHAYQHPVELRVVRDGGQATGHLKVTREGDKPWKTVVLGQSIGWAAHEEEETNYRDAEKLRLLYVAGTRAKQLLIVCRSEDSRKNVAWGAFESYLEDMPELAVPSVAFSPAPAVAARSDLSTGARAAAGTAREARHDHAREPSWAVTSVTGERAGLAPKEQAKGATGDSTATGDATGQRADAGVAWGSFIHGLLEHAMRHEDAARADLERLARWLTVEAPELRPFIGEALDLVEAAAKAPFWQDARAGAEVHVEVPFAVRVAATGPVATAASVPTVLRGVIDLAYRTGDGWRILDYKTDREGGNEQVMLARYEPQLGQYRSAWERAAGTPVALSGLVALRTMRTMWSR
jgi:ATP-dependent helicase/nuclease subunit A